MLRHITKGSETNRATPVVNDESHFVYAESIQQGTQVPHVSGKIVREGTMRGFIGETTTEMIRGNAAVFFPKGKNQFAIKERPSGVPMQHQDRWTGTLPLVEIMQSPTTFKL
jgi:hypothetical protein